MSLQSKSVLVVDDEPGMRMALKANFEREGWRVETAAGRPKRPANADRLHFL